MQYRSEIDGLRAIAVIPVLLFHAGLISGGYLGVDVFFIISGYLITSILLVDLHAGKLSLAHFYERRARRILPMLFLVTGISIPFAWYFMSAQSILEFAQSVISVEFFVSNLWFAHETNYFAESADLIPLLHTWSLAVEEQFYLIYPVVLAAIWRVSRKHVLWGLIFLLLASLLLAQILSTRSQVINFFLLPSRVWELMLGAILAYVEYRYGRKSHRLSNSLLPILGLIILLGSMGYFTDDGTNPSFITLIPALATALIIWFAGKNDIGTRLLASKLLVGIGLISYSIYLWHQPLLVFMRLANLGHLSTFAIISFIPITIGISYLSWRFVEMPLRNTKFICRRDFIGLLLSVFLILLAAAVCIYLSHGFPGRSYIPQQVASTIATDPTHPECLFNERSVDQWYCKIGNINKAKPDFAVMGSSHTEVAILGIEAAALTANKFGIAAHVSACAPIEGLDGGEDMHCADMKNRMYEFVSKNKIPTVIFIHKWDVLYKMDYKALPVGKESAEKIDAVNRLLAKTISKYNNIGTKVVIMLQVPNQKNDVVLVYENIYRFPSIFRLPMLRKYSLLAEEYNLEQASFLNSIKQYIPQATVFLNPKNQFCDLKICPLGAPRVSYYADNDHLSAAGSRRLYPLFLEFFATE